MQINVTRIETSALSLVGAVLLLAVVVPSGLVAQGRYESVAWTPDGKALTVAWRGDSTTADLFVLPIGEGAVRRLTEDPARDAFASWAPDGSAVAFASTRTGRGDIYVAAADGSNLRRLTQSDSADSWPSWSPDGRQIAFMSKQTGRWQIWLMAADGSGQKRVARSSRNDFNPRWSPDGRWLVFESDRDGGNQDELYVIASDGTGERRLTNTPGNDIFPDWSPLGDRIAYCTVEAGRASIRTIAPDGSDSKLLAEDACMPTWSPSGDRLAYQTAVRGQPAALRITRPDGSAVAGVPGPFGRDSAQAAADPRREIAAASLTFSRAYVAGDMATIRELYTPDAILLPPDREVRGRDAIARYFAPGPRSSNVAHSMTSEDLRIANGFATDVGTWRHTRRTMEGETREASGRYLVVWRRGEDGRWRIEYDMWHRPTSP